MNVRRIAAILLGCSALGLLLSASSPSPGQQGKPGPRTRGCSAEMARVAGFCIDRWEASMVDVETGRPLSPYYPPNPYLLRRVHEVWEVERHHFGDEAARQMPLPELPDWQASGEFAPKAVSVPGRIPQGYLTWHVAKAACEAAGKRLCREEEWVQACRGARATKFPYGSSFDRDKCNVYRYFHPAVILHGNSSVGHTDPRLNLVMANGESPVLLPTGAIKSCASRWGAADIYDMVGNLDEWVADEKGVFVGGFYARNTTKGCESRISTHATTYYDYSTGVRCCAAPR